MIAWFARNTVASNLLMLAIIFAGGYTLLSNKIPLEVFPELESNIVNVTVPYRGGTPEEVEESVVVKIEEAIADVEGIEEMISTAGESNGTVMVEVDDDYDRREVLEDIKNRVDAVSTFPPDSEKPVVALADSYHEVITVVLFGKLSELDLRRLGENIRDQILNLPGVTRAQLQGVRPYEVSIEIDEKTLQRYGLTFDTVAASLRNTSIDVPAGTLKTTSGDVVLRTRGRAYSGAEFENIVVATTPQGSRVTLADIATVNDGFNENPFIARFNGERAVVISVAREGSQNAITIARTVRTYMEERRPSLPPGVSMDFWSDRSKIVKGRLETLIKSGLQSMLGVFLLLALFLRPNLAFWVVVGIPVCFLGAIACMPYLGVTINVVSLFGFILVLGVVVDDAIVSGENIYTHHRRGAPWHDAAVSGAREVALPVIFGVLTTMLAFVPLLLGEGFMGRWAGDIAWIVIATLAFSLIESKLILPAHLSHRWLKTETFPHLLQLPFKAIDAVQSKFANGLERAVAKLYQPVLDLALRNRYTTVAIFVATLLLLIGFVGGGYITRIGFPRIASERAIARLSMNEGTPFETTAKNILRIRQIAEEMRDEFTEPDGSPLITDILSSIGGQGLSSSRSRNTQGRNHLGEVTFYVTAPETRNSDESMSSVELAAEWRKRIGPIIGAKELYFRAEIGRGGDPVDIQLASSNIADLEDAAKQVRSHLGTYPDLFDVSDSLDTARAEIQLTIKPEAQQFGLTLGDLARQVRQAFYGNEIQRIQRGRDEVRVFVRYPQERRKSLASLDAMRIRTPDGQEVPFSSVAAAEVGKSLPTIKRIDRNRVLNVTADVDKESADMEAITASMATFLDELIPTFPGMIYSFQGEAKERRENEASQRTGLMLVLFGIYAMLAIPFRSYVQPLIVMSVIPFGMIGAVLGHVIHSTPISMMSQFGLLALAGVVVNDSLVMVDFINRRHRKDGLPVFDAASTAGAARFRPIILTSLTTFVGLLPLIFMKSTQALFLIPMALSLGYGILFATAITLFLVPINYLILEDIKTAIKKLYDPSTGTGTTPADQKSSDMTVL